MGQLEGTGIWKAAWPCVYEGTGQNVKWAFNNDLPLSFVITGY